MTTRDQKVGRFRELHRQGCFIIPNPWDALSARLLEASGFAALATTSSGYAFSVGKQDGAGQLSRDEILAYAERIVACTDLPVTADLEDGYAATADGVAETVRLAYEAGLAGISIEDSCPIGVEPVRDFDSAVERVRAACEAARRYDIVLTARADGLGSGHYDLDETIRRLNAFEKAGADVVYAPGVPSLEVLTILCGAVRAPFNHVLGLGVSGLSFDEIAGAGVRRISLGGSFTRAACGAVRSMASTIGRGDFSMIDSAPSWNALWEA
ncbi:oxaloacetate decarboxylase [uncultured Methylobacterium sp.]|uniref:isocitrate lyase/PEP mutase family protein n=1 Tax=uncultured Methylobacterium sp. TaxID=157278 RepID=UPI0035C95AA9